MLALCCDSPVQTCRNASWLAPTTWAAASCMPRKTGLSSVPRPQPLLAGAGVVPHPVDGLDQLRVVHRGDQLLVSDRRGHDRQPVVAADDPELGGQPHGQVDPDRRHRVGRPEVVLGQRLVEDDRGPAARPLRTHGRPTYSPGDDPAAAARSAADEPGDDLPELGAGVLLHEVAGAGDHGVVEPRAARHQLAQDRRHRPGDRVAVGEGGEERLLPGLEDRPRRPGWPRWRGRRCWWAPGSASPADPPCSPRRGTARRRRDGRPRRGRARSRKPRSDRCRGSRPPRRRAGTTTRSRACRSRRSAARCCSRPRGRTGRGAPRPGAARSARPSPGPPA